MSQSPWGRPRAPGHQIQQSCPGPAVLAAGVVHDPGDQPSAGWAHVAPDVLVHAQGVHPGLPVLGGQLGLDDWSDGVPDGVPGDPEHLGQGRDRDVVAAQLRHRPSNRAGGELGPRCRQLVDLTEGRHLARRLMAAVAAFAPDHPHGHPGARQVVQQHRHPAMADGEHPASRTAHQ